MPSRSQSIPFQRDRTLADGDTCGASFVSYAQLAAHCRGAYSEASYFDRMVVTSQCPLCMTAFYNVQVAARHVKRVYAGGKCDPRRTHWAWHVRAHEVAAP